MKGKLLLPAMFVVTFALSRIPGLLPPNFSVAYAFAFCAGVYFPGALAWLLPLGVMLLTDVALNVFYYHEPPFALYLVLNYAVYALLIGLGKLVGRKASFFRLVLGGVARRRRWSCGRWRPADGGSAVLPIASIACANSW